MRSQILCVVACTVAAIVSNAFGGRGLYAVGVAVSRPGRAGMSCADAIEPRGSVSMSKLLGVFAHRLFTPTDDRTLFFFQVQQRAEPLRGGPELHRQERAAADLPQRECRPPHQDGGAGRADDRVSRAKPSGVGLVFRGRARCCCLWAGLAREASFDPTAIPPWTWRCVLCSRYFGLRVLACETPCRALWRAIYLSSPRLHAAARLIVPSPRPCGLHHNTVPRRLGEELAMKPLPSLSWRIENHTTFH